MRRFPTTVEPFVETPGSSLGKSAVMVFAGFSVGFDDSGQHIISNEQVFEHRASNMPLIVMHVGPLKHVKERASKYLMISLSVSLYTCTCI